MEKSFGNYFLGKVDSVTQKNVFGIDFARISDLSAMKVLHYTKNNLWQTSESDNNKICILGRQGD